jgi:hypothetical protein
MTESLLALVDSKGALLFIAILGYLAYRQLLRHLNGVGAKGHRLVSYLLETEPDEAKRKRLNEILKG